MTTKTPLTRRATTIAELAESLNIGQTSAYALVRDGRIRSVRTGPRGSGIRIPASALDDFLEGR